MPRPSLIGTPGFSTATLTDTNSATMTVLAGTKAVVFTFGGFANGAAITPSTVQGDPSGTPFDINDGSVYAQRGTNQFAGAYIIDDQNANWPGTGSLEIEVVMSGGSSNRQLKCAIFAFQDVDTAIAYLNGTQTGTGASSTPSMASLSSSSNALNIGCVASYSADTSGDSDDTVINSQQNGAGSSSLYTWHEDGTGATDTVEATSTVAWAGVCLSLEGTGGGGGGATPKGPLTHPLYGPFRGPIS